MYGNYIDERLILNCKMLFFDLIGTGKSFQTLVPLLLKLEEALPLVSITMTFSAAAATFYIDITVRVSIQKHAAVYLVFVSRLKTR